MILVAFDGTWNDENPDKGKWVSNVRRFWHCCTGPKIYKRGIGNNEEYSFLMRMLGGAFGIGGKSIVWKACLEVGLEIENGKKPVLGVVGFSRGGALALHFANTVAEHGVPLPSTKKKHRERVPNANGRGHRIKVTYTYEKRPVSVRWLGLWDVVPAMGIPGNDVNLGYQLKAPPGAIVSHAMALDVASGNFRLKRVDGAYEAWFMGEHSEVGGGVGNARLSDCTLRWMVGKALKQGVAVDLASLDLPAPGPLGLPQSEKEHDHSRRRVKPGDRVHRTVKRDHYPRIPWKDVTVVV